MNLKHLRDLVITPVLRHLGMYSPAAVQLVLGTAIQESGGFHLMQLGGGPALGLYQMEPATHDDIWRTFLYYRPDIADRVRTLELPGWYDDDNAREMEGNLYYATALCRLRYWRVSEPLPPPDDIHSIARYWKYHYNTHLGKGSTDEFLHNWQRHAPEEEGRE